MIRFSEKKKGNSDANTMMRVVKVDRKHPHQKGGDGGSGSRGTTLSLAVTQLAKRKLVVGN